MNLKYVEKAMWKEFMKLEIKMRFLLLFSLLNLVKDGSRKIPPRKIPTHETPPWKVPTQKTPTWNIRTHFINSLS